MKLILGYIFNCIFRIQLLFPFGSFDRYFYDRLTFSCCFENLKVNSCALDVFAYVLPLALACASSKVELK